MGDWRGKPFQVRLLTDLNARMVPRNDFDPSLKLGWDDRGLMVLAEVRDGIIRGDPEAEKLWAAGALPTPI